MPKISQTVNHVVKSGVGLAGWKQIDVNIKVPLDPQVVMQGLLVLLGDGKVNSREKTIVIRKML